MPYEHWLADRAELQRLLQDHPEWSKQELAQHTSRSLGWIKKWKKRFREAPVGDTQVLLGKPFGRKTPYPQTDPEVEQRILAIRDAPPEHLQRTPGPRAILSYLPRDPLLQHRIETLHPIHAHHLENFTEERLYCAEKTAPLSSDRASPAT